MENSRMRRGEMGISKKKYKRHKWHPTINLCRKFPPIWTMGKFSKLGGKFRRKWGG